MTARLLTQNSLEDFFWRGVLGSLLVHVLLIALALFSGMLPGTAKEAPEQALMVTLVPPPRSREAQAPPVIPRQIVSPPENTSETPPKDPTFLSERDSFALRVQIKRGDDPEAGAPGGASNSRPSLPHLKEQPPQKTMAKVKSEPVLKDAAKSSAPFKPAFDAKKPLAGLKLDRETLIQKFSVPETESTEDRLAAALGGQPAASSRTNSLSDSRPFARAPGSGARIMGNAGSNDFLPALPDGDITMLNAKASLFAVFVRRVAVQVFGHLRASGWEHLRAEDIQSMTTDTTVRAVLSKDGKLLKVELEDGSGSSRFDEVLRAAVQSGARDPNPPAAAALRDGNIHFVFKARSWVRYAADPRSGFPGERRWLVLGTGLD